MGVFASQLDHLARRKLLNHCSMLTSSPWGNGDVRNGLNEDEKE